MSNCNYRADVFALDMWKAEWEADPMKKSVGEKFRDLFLAPGASQPPMKTLVDYLGREPSADAGLERLGL